jgi:DNA-binding protein H-NS
MRTQVWPLLQEHLAAVEKGHDIALVTGRQVLKPVRESFYRGAYVWDGHGHLPPWINYADYEVRKWMMPFPK